jgi:nucleotidyltransferase/DNA polymerase involved in DNA repair
MGGEGAGRVIDLSEECRAAGARVGMAPREAAELVPDAVFLPPNPDADAEVVGRALDLLERFSEVVEETDDGAWFAPAGPLRGTTDERRLAATVVDGLAAGLGLEARLALAPGKYAARLIARHAADAVAVVPDGGIPAHLAPWPIERLPLSSGAVHRLRLLGISTVGGFARLPANGIPRRFGREAALAHQIARGEETAALVPRRRPEVRTLRRTFEPPVEDRGILLGATLDLLRRLGARLQVEGKTFRSLGLAVGLEDGRVAEHRIDLRLPAAEPRKVQGLLRAMVEALTLDSAIAHVTLRLGEIAREAPAQPQFFDDPIQGTRAERRERFKRALGEVARRYHGHVRRVVPGADPASLIDDDRLLLLPYEPDDDLHATVRPERASLAEPAIRGRPVRLVARGKRIYVVEENPEGDGAQAPRDEIVALHARWEADEWWPTPARRTYYRVRTGAGTIATLARDHLRSDWLLMGNFD